jgi:hypothetical protein
MSAYYTGYASNNATTDELFAAVRAALIANGWTEYDVLSDTGILRDIVFRSAPIDPVADNRCFCRFTYSSSGWGCRQYTDWAVATHNGANASGFNPSNTYITYMPTSKYHIAVNEFAIAYSWTSYQSPAAIYNNYAGFFQRGLSSGKSGLTKTTTSYSIGATTLNVASDMTGKLQPNQRVVIYNQSHSQTANFSNAELLTIQSVASGSITFSSGLTKAYDSGAVIGWNPNPLYCSMGTVNSGFVGSGYTSLNLDGTYTNITGQSVITDMIGLVSTTVFNPFDVYGYTHPPAWFTSYTNTASKRGYFGVPYHWVGAATSINLESFQYLDTISNGTSSFVMMPRPGTISIPTSNGGCGFIGPV